MDATGPAWPCDECTDQVALCSECHHRHDHYMHVGPHEHMCVWCLRSDYEHDPVGLPPHVRRDG